MNENQYYVCEPCGLYVTWNLAHNEWRDENNRGGCDSTEDGKHVPDAEPDVVATPSTADPEGTVEVAHSYAFDVPLNVVVRLKATSEEAGRKMLDELQAVTLDVSVQGLTITEASTDPTRPARLFERDGVGLD